MRMSIGSNYAHERIEAGEVQLPHAALVDLLSGVTDTRRSNVQR